MNSPSIQAALCLLATIFAVCAPVSSATEVAILADSTYIDNGSGEAADNLATALLNIGIQSTSLTDFDARDLADWEELFEDHDILIIPELVKNRLSGHLDPPEAAYLLTQLEAGKRLILCGSLENEDAVNFMNEVFGWTIESVSDDGDGKVLRDRRTSWLRLWVDLESAGNHNRGFLVPEINAFEGTALVESASLPREAANLRDYYESFFIDGVFSRLWQVGVFATPQMVYLGWNYSDLSLDPQDEWLSLLSEMVVTLPLPSNGSQVSLDASFGTNGITTTGTPEDAETWDGPRQHRALTLLPDGSILATGAGAGRAFAVWKYLPSGQLDTSFGNDGVSRIEVMTFEEEYEEEYRQETAYAITTDSAGNIFLTGRILTLIEEEDETTTFDVGVVKLLPSGQVDPTFGEEGVVLLSAVTGEEIFLEDDGTILIVARENYESRDSTSPEGEAVVFRLLPNGELDPSYGVNGIRRIPGFGPSSVRSVRLDDGSLMVAGTWESAPSNASFTLDLFLAKITPGGEMDSAFGTNGLSIVSLAGHEMEVHDVVQQNDGKFVLTGRENADSGPESLALVRLLSDGSLDSSFGDGGRVFASYRNSSLVGHAVTLQPDNKIVAVGSAFDGIGFQMMLARFLPTGEPDASFGEQGVTTFELPDATLNETIEDLVPLPDGGFLIAGAGIPTPSLTELGDGSYSSFLAKISLTSGATYESWISGFDLAASEQAHEDDPDEDGLNNLLEYAFNLDPGDTASRATPDFLLDSNGQLTTSYGNLRQELVYLVEGSDDLQNWDSVGILSASANFEVTDSAMVGTDPRRFVRFRIETSGAPTLTQLTAPTPTASSSQTGNDPEDVQDGDLGTRWSAEGLGESLTFTFANPVTVEEIRVAFFEGTNRTASFRVEASTDGTFFFEILSETTSSGTTNDLQSFPVANSLSVSTLRFVGEGNSVNLWNSITEIEWWGE